MKILGVLSDTHMHDVDKNLAALFESGGIFGACSAIIHAGDFTSASILDFLEERVTVYGVQGNMDESALRRRLPKKRIISIEGLRIGITHGWGAPMHLDQRVYQLFDDKKLDCIVFGHSHIPVSHFIGKTLMFNPGSYKGRWPFQARSVGKLLIDRGEIRGELIPL